VSTPIPARFLYGVFDIVSQELFLCLLNYCNDFLACVAARDVRLLPGRTPGAPGTSRLRLPWHHKPQKPFAARDLLPSPRCSVAVRKSQAPPKLPDTPCRHAHKAANGFVGESGHQEGLGHPETSIGQLATLSAVFSVIKAVAAFFWNDEGIRNVGSFDRGNCLIAGCNGRGGLASNASDERDRVQWLDRHKSFL
jgi:hypothetical protein